MNEALKTATLCNISPLEFWELTPYELNLKIKAFYDHQKSDLEKQITIAYINSQWTAQFALSKHKPKPLKDILDKLNNPKKIMSDKQMLEQVKQLNAVFGGLINEK